MRENPADLADLATEQETLARDLTIQRARLAGPEVGATGYCLNCGDDLPVGVRWCNKDCATDWERRRR